MTTHGHEYVEGLLASYALEAVSEDEQRAVGQHLPSCDACTRRLAELQRTAASLAVLPEQRSPPAELKSRIMSAVLNERTAPTPASPIPRAGRWWQSRAFAAVAAAVVVLLATSAVLGAGWMRARDHAGRSDRLRAHSYDALEVMARAEQRWSVTGTEDAPGARGVLAYSIEDRRASLVVWELPAVEGASYNVWTLEEGRRVPAGRMWQEADGWWAVLPVGPRDLEGIGVTLVRKDDGKRADVVDFPIPDDPDGGAAR
ncbi:MAG: anti-sigma factor [Chloroflexi bacterium]|nr:anti-sigma factor [Chloroflexota bacterium]